MAVWIVRGGSHAADADAEREFLESSSVGIYFGVDQPIDGMNEELLRREIQRSYIDWVEERGVRFQPGVVTRFLNQVLAFRDGIQPGDTIVMPRKASGGHSVAQGTAYGGYEYWGSEHYRHRRRVRWLEAEAPRESIEHVWSASDQRTVFRIDRA